MFDENRNATLLLVELLRFKGDRVTTAFDAASASQRANIGRCDVGFLALGLPDINGHHLAESLWALQTTRRCRCSLSRNMTAARAVERRPHLASRGISSS
jgi:DNA-binding response OmpR family regulator